MRSFSAAKVLHVQFSSAGILGCQPSRPAARRCEKMDSKPGVPGSAHLPCLTRSNRL